MRNIENLRIISVFLFFSSLVFPFFIYYACAEDIPEQSKVIYTGGEYESPFQSWLPVSEKVDEGEIQQTEPTIRDDDDDSLPSLALQGIVLGEQFPQAIINDSVVREGDKIENAEILKIDKDKIKLLYRGQIFFLPVNK